MPDATKGTRNNTAMISVYMIGLISDGEAFYTDSAKPLDAQKADSLAWAGYDLIKVLAVVGSEVTDITAAYCRMWINKADLSDMLDESDFPSIIRETVPELVTEALRELDEADRAQRQLASDYRASVL